MLSRFTRGNFAHCATSFNMSKIDYDFEHPKNPLEDGNEYIKSFHQAMLKSGWKPSVQKYNNNRLLNTLYLVKRAKQKKFDLQPYSEFELYDRGKHRDIQALQIQDRIQMDNFCKNVLMPKIRPKIIYDTCASVDKRGITFARTRFLYQLQHFVRKHKVGYVLKIDFKKFFPSIDHEKCKEIYFKLIKDEYFRKIIEKNITSFNQTDKGLGVGSHFSQLTSVIYPTALDQYCKTILRIKNYVRYMDDIIILHEDKRELRKIKDKIAEYSNNKLLLNFNIRKTQISSFKQFKFLQSIYRVYPETHKIVVRIKTKNLARYQKKLQKIVWMHPNFPKKEFYNNYKSFRLNLISNYPKGNYHKILQCDKYFKSVYKSL